MLTAANSPGPRRETQARENREDASRYRQRPQAPSAQQCLRRTSSKKGLDVYRDWRSGVQGSLTGSILFIEFTLGELQPYNGSLQKMEVGTSRGQRSMCILDISRLGWTSYIGIWPWPAGINVSGFGLPRVVVTVRNGISFVPRAKRKRGLACAPDREVLSE